MLARMIVEFTITDEQLAEFEKAVEGDIQSLFSPNRIKVGLTKTPDQTEFLISVELLPTETIEKVAAVEGAAEESPAVAEDTEAPEGKFIDPSLPDNIYATPDEKLLAEAEKGAAGEVFPEEAVATEEPAVEETGKVVAATEPRVELITGCREVTGENTRAAEGKPEGPTVKIIVGGTGLAAAKEVLDVLAGKDTTPEIEACFDEATHRVTQLVREAVAAEGKSATEEAPPPIEGPAAENPGEVTG